MNSQSALSLARRSTLAALLAGAALLLGACSTTSVASGPGEKTYSYAELHSMMVKLAQEPAPGSGVRPIEAMAASSGELGGSRTLAANP